ncbi:MAG: hypothetical protein WCK65_08090 [Rhodospirillaceae bacterium]
MLGRQQLREHGDNVAIGKDERRMVPLSIGETEPGNSTIINQN